MNNIIDNMEYFEINGIKGALIRRDDIESITVSILLKTGNSFDEPLKSGVSSLTSILLNKGTKGLSAMDIADEFDSMGTSFLSTSGKDATFINLWTLKENFKKSMNLLKKNYT
jgi:predicted Zn-dependent peptidase